MEIKQTEPDFEAERKLVQRYLTNEIATASMVAAALNIYRPNLCRHKRELEKVGLLTELYKDICLITGFEAAYLSCDPGIIERFLREKSKQLTLEL